MRAGRAEQGAVDADKRVDAQLEAQLSEGCSMIATEGRWHGSKLLSDKVFFQKSIQSIMDATDMRRMLAGA